MILEKKAKFGQILEECQYSYIKVIRLWDFIFLNHFVTNIFHLNFLLWNTELGLAWREFIFIRGTLMVLCSGFETEAVLMTRSKGILYNVMLTYKKWMEGQSGEIATAQCLAGHQCICGKWQVIAFAKFIIFFSSCLLNYVKPWVFLLFLVWFSSLFLWEG